MSLSGLQSQAEAVDKLAEIQARLRLGEPGVRAVAISAAAVGPKIERHAAHLDDFIAYRIAHTSRCWWRGRAPCTR